MAKSKKRKNTGARKRSSSTKRKVVGAAIGAAMLGAAAAYTAVKGAKRLKRKYPGKKIKAALKTETKAVAEKVKRVEELLNEYGFELEIKEPDIVFSHQGKKFGIAVKRLTGINKVKLRIKKGIEQIENSNYPGFVAVSFDQIIQPEGRGGISSNLIFNKSIAMEILDTTLTEHENIIQTQVKNPCVGLIGFLKVLFIAEDGFGIFTDSAERWLPAADSYESSFDLIKSISDKINI